MPLSNCLIVILFITTFPKLFNFKQKVDITLNHKLIFCNIFSFLILVSMKEKEKNLDKQIFILKK